MNPYKNFRLAAYAYAYHLASATDEQLRQAIDYYAHHVHLDKVYLENHRALVDVPAVRLREIKALFEENGIAVSGGITATALVNGESKPTFYDTFCYTDPAHRERFLQLVRESAAIFDEIILDDFFFTNCTCEMCIAAKGQSSWQDYRLELMADFSRIVVAEARKVNPHINFIIKYPNWSESYQATGYNPGLQKDIFDMIYTGTETRDPKYSAQHLQRYMSYSLMRLMENIAPGRNGGGWIDPFGSFGNLNFYLQQADMTLLGKARELMLFNFSVMEHTAQLPALGHELIRMDQALDKFGKPVGTPVWEPYDADGEDQLYNYLGMRGLALDPTPDFPANAPTVLFTENTACCDAAMAQLESYVRNGGTAIVTTGFFRRCYDQGILELTSARLTNRHILADEYMVSDYNYPGAAFCKSPEKLLFDILTYKTNATWGNISLIADEYNCPLLTEDRYGKGRMFILNIPDNYADLYKIPRDVWQAVARHISCGQRVYTAGDGKHIFISYDNNTYAIQSCNPMPGTVNVIVRGECSGIRNLETGAEYTQGIAIAPPAPMADCASIIPEPPERCFTVPVGGGSLLFFEVMDGSPSNVIVDSYLHTNPYE